MSLRKWTMLGLVLVFAGPLESSFGETPPQVIYHVGQKEYLLQNVEAKTVPLDVWQDFIMGEKTRFGLPQYRRGLYGAKDPMTPLYFGDDLILKQKLPWLIEITIDDTCRVASKVAQSSYDSYANSQFRNWLNKNYSIRGLKTPNECFAPGNVAGEFYFMSGEGYLVNGETQCTLLLSDYLKSSDFKIVYDTLYDNSWYIRDRACIKNIRGTADDLVSILFSSKFWGSVPGDAGLKSVFLLMTQVLQEAKTLDQNSVKKLISTIEKGKPDPKEGGYEELVGEYWTSVQKLAQAYLTCSKNSDLETFRAHLKKYTANPYNIPEFTRTLGQLCVRK